jgi:hypothetical protein
LIHISSGEFGVLLRPHDWGFPKSLRKLEDMVSDVEPKALPSRNVGGEFVGKVSIADLLSKLDAGAPYNGCIFGGGLRLYSKKIAEKIPMGFNSKESFAKMDEDSNLVD